MLPTIRRFPQVESTQDTARMLLDVEHVNVGHIVMADSQTGGRGRYGRSWLSPYGGLYATLILKPRPLISIASGLAVSRALDGFDVHALLKWPNDIEHEGRKLGGILVERTGEVALVGIGVNLDGEPLSSATSTRRAGANVRRGDLLLAIWQHLEGGEPGEDLLASYRKRSATLGRRVRVTVEHQRIIEGLAIDVDEAGRLLVDVGDHIEETSSGSCEHIG